MEDPGIDVKIILKESEELGWGDVDTDQWQALADMVIHHGVPYRALNFYSS